MGLIVSTVVSANVEISPNSFESLEGEFMIEHYSYPKNEIDTQKIINSWEKMADMLSELRYLSQYVGRVYDKFEDLRPVIRAFIEDSLDSLSDPLMKDSDKKTIAMKLNKNMDQDKDFYLELSDYDRDLISSIIRPSKSSSAASNSVPISGANNASTRAC